MSNATEEQQPQAPANPADDTTQAAPPAPAASTDDTEDWDLQELRMAMAEANAETATPANEDPAQGVEPQGQQPVEGTQPAQPAQPAVEPGSPMIPKARLDEVLRERTTASEQAEFWRGVAEGRIAHPGAPQGTPPQVQQPAPQQPPQPSVNDQLQTLRAQQDELARKFDDGDITFSDYNRQNRELDDKIDSAREAQIMQRVQEQSRGQQDNLYLDARTVELETQHPYLGIVSREDLAFLTHTAVSQLRAEGVQLVADDARSKLAIRERAAVLSDRYGKDWGYQLPGGTAPSAPPAQQVQTGPTAQDRAAKLNLQGTMPPNTAGMNGAGRDDPAGITEAQIETMSEEDIAALPPAVRNRLLGIT